MKISRFLAGLAALCFAASATAADAPRAEHVFIISLDQGAPFNIEKADMPALKAMAEEGAHTWNAYTIVPSLTLPSHTSMLTGVGIQKHQIDWNDSDPEKGFVQVPTIFGLAKAKGLRTAMVVSKMKLKTLALPGTVDDFLLPEKPDTKSVEAAAVELIKKARPNLCFVHFGEPDSVGHQYGVSSPEKIKALVECDAAIANIRTAIASAGLADSSVIIVTADHGGRDRTPEENAEREKKGLPFQPGTHGSPKTVDVEIPWIAWGEDVKPHYTITAPVVTYDTAATALWLLGIPIPEDFWGRPVTSAFQPEN